MKNPDPALEALGRAAEQELLEMQRFDDSPTRLDGEITRSVASQLGDRGGTIYMKQGCTSNGQPVSAIVLGPCWIEGQDFKLRVGRGTEVIVISRENARFWTTKRPKLWS